jgi:hypothetical protein
MSLLNTKFSEYVMFNHYATFSEHDFTQQYTQYSRPDTCFILSLYISRNRRDRLNVKACSLAIACGLWVIHRARLRRHFSQTHSSTLMLLSEWKWMVRDILIAKRRTAMERNTSLQFNGAWKCLLDITDLSVTA